MNIEDKTRNEITDLCRQLEDLRSRLIAGGSTPFQVTAHLARRPFDWCPFECEICEALRPWDIDLVTRSGGERQANT